MSAETYLEKYGHRKLGAPPRPVEEKHRVIARNVLRKGMAISEALGLAGYAPKQAAKGMATVRNSNALRTAFAEEAQRIEQDAKNPKKAPLFPTEGALEGLIMSRLERNIIKGEDKAVMSCRLAGSHKRVALWTQDAVTGVIVVNAPTIIGHAHDEVPEDDD